MLNKYNNEYYASVYNNYINVICGTKEFLIYNFFKESLISQGINQIYRLISTIFMVYCWFIDVNKILHKRNIVVEQIKTLLLEKPGFYLFFLKFLVHISEEVS